MKLDGFYIKNYKSIVDSGWCSLSQDNITVFIGQNEAGKTAILEALRSFEIGKIHESALRTDGSFPEVGIRYQTSREELSTIFPNLLLRENELNEIEKLSWKISLFKKWDPTNLEKAELFNVSDKSLRDVLLAPKKPMQIENLGDIKPEEILAQITNEHKEGDLGYTERDLKFADSIWRQAPDIITFDENQGLLPGMIDVAEVLNDESQATGVIATRNFLSIAGIEDELSNILRSGLRVTDTRLDRASTKVTNKLQKFWRQTIGTRSKIELRCEMKNHPSSDQGKEGQPFLTFWIIDDVERLHPEQRSRGVRWFVSFFLQLLNSAQQKEGRGSVYLLDEPGGSLHMKAQEDVVSVLESIKDDVQIIYTTHSPYMIDIQHIYRINAVQRVDAEDETSPTQIISGIRLASASRETESPRVLRRLQTLREWSHEQDKPFFPRSPRTRGAHGAGAPWRIPLAVGGD